MKNTKLSTRIAAVVIAVFMLLSTAPISEIALDLGTGISASAASTKKISSCKFTVSSSVVYTGKKLTPTVKVKYGSKTLKAGKHYTVKYSNNKAIGKATIKITGIKSGGYTGTKTLSFKIVPAKVKGLSSSKQTTSSVKLGWTKVKGAEKYVVYTYNSSTKKYTKVKTVTTNSATVSKLSAGTKYYFAVRALKKAGSTNYYGAYSANLKVSTAKAATVTPPPTTDPTTPTTPTDPTNPTQPTTPSTPSNDLAAVKSVKATKKGETVTISWAAVSGATGYEVSSYDSSTKKYTVLSTTTATKVSLTTLKKDVTYTIVVRAYKTSGSKKVYGDYSSSVKATVYYADKYNTIFQAGTIKATIKSSDFAELSNDPITIATKNGNFYMKAKMNVDASTKMDITMIYNKKKNKTVCEVMGICFDATSLLGDDDIFSEANIFAAIDLSDTSDVTVSSTTLSGKKVTVETVKLKNGEKVKLYVDSSGNLVRITLTDKYNYSSVIDITSFSTDVKDSLFKIPAIVLDVSALDKLL